jgi:hypothetical protein
VGGLSWKQQLIPAEPFFQTKSCGFVLSQSLTRILQVALVNDLQNSRRKAPEGFLGGSPR